MSITRAYQNYLKQEASAKKKSEEKMRASNASTGLLAPRGGRNKQAQSDTSSSQFDSVNSAIQAIRNRKI